MKITKSSLARLNKRLSIHLFIIISFLIFTRLSIPALAQSEEVLILEGNGTMTPAAAGSMVIETFPSSLIEQVLSALENPLVLSVLLIIGILAVMVELSSPGGWIAGLFGVLAIGLALYGLWKLPVNWLGLGLILLAVALFLLEVKVPTHGALAVTGVLLLIGGLLVLFNTSRSPEFLAISIPSAIGLSSITAVFFLFIVGKALSAQRTQAATGAEGLLGKIGPVRSTFSSESFKAPYSGMVFIAGELWRAQSNEKIQIGEQVVVTGMKGFTLLVERLDKLKD
jgi:membrane-bound serine protease (ClpP class)